MRVRNQLLLTHGLLVLLALVIVFINIMTYQRMDNDASIINYSGKLRALSYNMGLLADNINSHESSVGFSDLREQLEIKMNEFESILVMLSEKANSGIKHRPTVVELEEVRTGWYQTFKPLYETVLGSDETSHFSVQINSQIESFVNTINHMVTTYTEYARRKVFTALSTNALLIIVIIAVTIFSFSSSNKHIQRPMQVLMKDLKDVSLINDEASKKLSIMDTNEISEMSRYFNVMVFDQLTGAFNRRSGLAKLNRIIHQDNRRSLTISLCFIDINGLKEVNDHLGHKYGDELIVSVVKGITNEIRDEDFVIRMGGDEFLFVMKGIGVDLSEKVWERINDVYKMVNDNENRPYMISVSHGIAEYNNLGEVDIEELIKKADDKMYVEKRHLKEVVKVDIIKK